eukprot:TRINITY_DN3756_c0_g1_i1.p1 TRINITY_DN3756_c0_g1~~TRINITY_DN3756_c0_g1_i1.p1  ORF type:complete len:183 (-),score=33.02 TRINITY_DN3756_c0_g1_i1:248-796(-)
MFEITLANWPTACRVLSENVSEWFMPMAIMHKLCIGFAVVGVINGVFMQETFKVASLDDRIMMRQKKRANEIHARKMGRLFDFADESGDGSITLDEWRDITNDPETKLWLASMELDVRDTDQLFLLMDRGDGQLHRDQLAEGISRLKGPARSIDLESLKRDQAQLLQDQRMLCERFARAAAV